MHKLNQKTTRLQRFFGARSFDLFPDIFASLKCARKGIFLPKNPVSNHTRWEFSFSSPLHEIQKTLAVFLGFSWLAAGRRVVLFATIKTLRKTFELTESTAKKPNE